MVKEQSRTIKEQPNYGKKLVVWGFPKVATI